MKNSKKIDKRAVAGVIAGFIIFIMVFGMLAPFFVG